MTKKTIVTALLVLITLSIPLSLYSQSQDFVMNGTVLTKYNGSAASVTIPSGVTAIGEMAFTHSRITSVTIPTSVTSIGNSAFAYCRSLTSVTIPTSVTYIEDLAFNGCTSLTSITVDSQNSEYSSVDGILFDKNRTGIITYPAGKQGTSYTIPSSVTYIEKGAFYECYNLSSITIPSSVTSIGFGAFAECTSLTSITIPSSVTYIGNSAFSNCTNLTSITIPSSVTSIRDYAFSNCTSLTSINVDAQNREFSSVDGVLFNKNRTRIITYPAGKQGTSYTIPSSVTHIRDRAFQDCTSLTSITIPSSVTSIWEAAFGGCTSLTSITIPASVTYISNGAFYNCNNLVSVTFQGMIASGSFSASNSFPGDLRNKYLDADNGGIGTYTRTLPATTWTKE